MMAQKHENDFSPSVDLAEEPPDSSICSDLSASEIGMIRFSPHVYTFLLCTLVLSNDYGDFLASRMKPHWPWIWV